MQLSKQEQWVVEEFKERNFKASLDYLIADLMRYGTNDLWKDSIDGVFFADEKWSERNFRGVGAAQVMSDFHFEPVRVDLELTDDFGALGAGIIKFGSCSLLKRDQEKDRKKIENAFLVDPAFEFDWMRVFVFDGESWSASAPTAHVKG